MLQNESKKLASFKMPIKVGSNEICLNLYRETTCLQVIQMSLEHCRVILPEHLREKALLKQKLKCYGLFERANGIERLIKYDQNVFQLWLEWKLKNEQGVEFLVKLWRRTNKIAKTMTRNKKFSTDKIFEMNRLKENEIKTHIYEKIEDDDDSQLEEKLKPSTLFTNSLNVDQLPNKFANEVVKTNQISKNMNGKYYLKKIVHNENKLNKQTAKLMKLDQSIAGHAKMIKKLMKLYSEKVQTVSLSKNVVFDSSV
jgi:hypothetical protein